MRFSCLLLVFLLGLLLLSLVFPRQFPLGVDQVEDHHQHHEDDDDVLTLPRHVFGHPGVEACLDCLNLLPDIVYKAHTEVLSVLTVCNKVNVSKKRTSVTYNNDLLRAPSM